MRWRQTASHRFQKASQSFVSGGQADLQECVEHLDETLVIAFKGFLNENGIETGRRTLFSGLVNAMGQQPEVALSASMQRFCVDIHDVRNRSRYDGRVPEEKFLLQALGFVRSRLAELDVEIAHVVPLGYDPLGRRRTRTRKNTTASRVTPQAQVIKKSWIRVNDLCRELEVKAKQVLVALAEIGVQDRVSQSSWIDRMTADRLRDHLKKGK